MTTADLVQTRTHSPALATPDDADAAAQIVSAQWRRASAGLVEIVRFGALMVQIERGLAPRQTRGGLYQGQTLKGWLSERCPEVNYNTAKGYKAAAVGLAEAAALPDAMPLLTLMDGEAAFAPEHQAAHDSVMAVLASSSIAFLKAQSRRGGARPGAGRPPKTDPAPAHIEAGAEWAGLGAHIDRALGWGFDRHLPRAMAIEALETATLLRDALKRRVEELKREGVK